jgi:radical SAM protein with 4Fe4S-binding SPASM domain
MAWMKSGRALRQIPALVLRGKFGYSFDGMPLTARRMPFRKRLNLLQCGLDMALKRDRLRGRPPAVQVEPTNFCNLKCPLCPTGTGAMPRAKGFMSRETFQKVLDDLGDSVVGMLLYGWGEPFLNKDLPWMIGQCTARGIVTGISTNGHCLQSRDEALQVVDAGLNALVVAIDGSTQEIYRAYRKSGDVEKVKRCAALIEEAKAQRGSPYPYTNLRAVVTSENERDLPNLRQLAQNLGVNMFSTKTVGCLTRGAHDADYEKTKPANRRSQYEGAERVRHPPVKCPRPFRQPMVFWDGTVVGCEFDYGLETTWGKISEQPFTEIWNSPRALQLRHAIRAALERPDFCKACPYQDRGQDRSVIGCEELRPLGMK